MIEPPINTLPRREKLAQILPLVEEGYTAEQIGLRVGMKRRAVCALLARSGMPMGHRGSTQRVQAHIPHRVFRVVDEIAQEAGVSRSTMVKRIVAAVCETPGDARRFLGKQARRAKA